jgi:hypothetical protein
MTSESWILFLCTMGLLVVAILIVISIIVALGPTRRRCFRSPCCRRTSSECEASTDSEASVETESSADGGEDGGDDDSGFENLLGQQGPIKAVYVGYAAGVSSIASTVVSAAQAGFNVILLAFYMGPGTGTDPYSAAWYWSQLSDSDKVSTIATVHGLGTRVMVSAGGAGYNAYPIGGGTAFGQGSAQFAIDNHLDGVDFDLENFTSAFGTTSGMNKGQTLGWMRDANAAARSLLGDDALITHAPQTPYLNSEFSYGYLDFMTQEPTPSVDWLNLQFYNQGSTYLTYDSQFISNTFHPGTSIAELISAGIPKEKLVIGRVTQAVDGSPWLDPSTLHSWFVQASSDSRTQNWKTGLMTWQWHSVGDGSPSSASFLTTVYPA